MRDGISRLALTTAAPAQPFATTEVDALRLVLESISRGPGAVLHQMATAAQRACAAPSACVTLAAPDEQGQTVCTWPVVLGDWTPPSAGPSLLVLLFGETPRVLTQPAQLTHFLGDAAPEVSEAMLAHWRTHSGVRGILWAVNHQRESRFAADDARRLQAVAHCGAAAYQVAQTLQQVALPPVAGTGIDDDVAWAQKVGLMPGRCVSVTRQLSEREFQVVSLVARGHTHQAIANALGLGVKSVETYRARAADKLGVRSRAELVSYALSAGLLDSHSA